MSFSGHAFLDNADEERGFLNGIPSLTQSFSGSVITFRDFTLDLEV